MISGCYNASPLILSIKPNCLTISIGEPDCSEVFSYDYAGRLWTLFVEGTTYRRGLDGKIIAKRRIPGGLRERCWLSPAEGLQIEERARREVARLYAAIQSGQAHLTASLPEHTRRLFEQILAFDAGCSQADAARYRHIYTPVGILPPDQYLALVLQVTEGCSFNTCSFCGFYRDRPFRIKSPGEFRSHALAVRDFLGAGLSLRRGVFLGAANALVAPVPKLLPLLDIVHEVFGEHVSRGIYAFLDGFSGERKSVHDYRALAERGLSRVYIGMESGSADLLRFLHKPGEPDDVLHAADAMKRGGVAVGLIVLIGAGGRQYDESHVRETIAALNAMPLDRRDIIYFSRLVVKDDAPYVQEAAQAGLEPLRLDEMIAQEDIIMSGLSGVGGRNAPRISRYNIQEFIY